METLGTVGTATIIATGPNTATLVMNPPGSTGSAGVGGAAAGAGGGTGVTHHPHPHHPGAPPPPTLTAPTQAEVISDGTQSYVSVTTTNGGQAYITAEQYESLQAQLQQQQQQHSQQQHQQQHGVEEEDAEIEASEEKADHEASLQVAEQSATETSGRDAVYDLTPEVSSERGYSLTTTQNPAEPGIVTSTDLNSPPQEEEEEEKDSEEAEVIGNDGKDRKHVSGSHVYKTPRGLLFASAAEVLKSSSS